MTRVPNCWPAEGEVYLMRSPTVGDAAVNIVEIPGGDTMACSPAGQYFPLLIPTDETVDFSL